MVSRSPPHLQRSRTFMNRKPTIDWQQPYGLPAFHTCPQLNTRIMNGRHTHRSSFFATASKNCWGSDGWGCHCSQYRRWWTVWESGRPRLTKAPPFMNQLRENLQPTDRHLQGRTYCLTLMLCVDFFFLCWVPSPTPTHASMRTSRLRPSGSWFPGLQREIKAAWIIFCSGLWWLDRYPRNKRNTHPRWRSL